MEGDRCVLEAKDETDIRHPDIRVHQERFFSELREHRSKIDRNGSLPGTSFTGCNCVYLGHSAPVRLYMNFCLIYIKFINLSS